MRKYVFCVFVGSFLAANSADLATFNRSANAADRPISLTSASKSDSTLAPSEVREFEVRVDNKAVGTHTITIKSEKEKEEASLQTDVKMDFIVYAYVFKFRGTEVWNDGRIESTEIRVEDGGKKRSYSMKTNGDAQQVLFNGKALPKATSAMMSTAYWRLPDPDFRSKAFAIHDVDTGATKEASFHLVGDTTVPCNGRSLTCEHYKIDGPSPAELWFDDKNRLVRQKSIEQGHAMELRLKQIRIAKEDR